MVQQGHRKMIEILESFWALEFKPHGRHFLEHPFEFVIDGVTIRGKIDRVDVEPDGLVLIDYKTGSGSLSAIKAQEDLQLALYYLAALQDPVLEPLGTPKELAYVYVAQPQTKSLKRVKQTIYPDHRERVEARIRGLIAAMRSEAFDWSPHADCGFCAYKTICRRYPEGGDPAL
jgi:RecB family exonuclease